MNFIRLRGLVTPEVLQNYMLFRGPDTHYTAFSHLVKGYSIKLSSTNSGLSSLGSGRLFGMTQFINLSFDLQSLWDRAFFFSTCQRY